MKIWGLSLWPLEMNPAACLAYSRPELLIIRALPYPRQLLLILWMCVRLPLFLYFVHSSQGLCWHFPFDVHV